MSRQSFASVIRMNTSQPRPYTAAVPIRFRQGDPVGISFFANVYPMAHDTFEDFVQHLGFDWKMWFANEEWGVPLRHTSCDYHQPLVPGTTPSISVLVEHLGESSLKMKYLIKNGEKVAAEVTLVHTFVSFKTRTKMPMPSVVRDRLEAYQRECLGS
jgi:acyl-CoA thioesterase FadM